MVRMAGLRCMLGAGIGGDMCVVVCSVLGLPLAAGHRHSHSPATGVGHFGWPVGVMATVSFRRLLECGRWTVGLSTHRVLIVALTGRRRTNRCGVIIAC